MPDPLNAEAVFLEHLAWIDKAAAKACRRHGLWGADAEDFASWAKMKIMENDYAVLRKFRGESDWKTFLATVVVHHFHAYSRERRGRWRPSAAAQRLGPPARELETLVRRDGYTVAQAGEKLRTSGITDYSDGELARLLASLPERDPLRPVQVAAEPVLESARAPSRSDTRVAASEAEAWRGDLMAALERAMGRMEPADRMIVRMHFGDGHKLADVARALGIEQKPLYRRIHKLRDELREHLEREGISARDVRAMLDWEEA